jgi:organic radical activating enzyme
MYEKTLFDRTIAESATNSFRWVNLTGGEPLMQDFVEYISLLQKFTDLKLAVETNGTICPDYIESFDFVTVSPKFGGMAPNKPVDIAVVKALLRRSKNNQLKLVISSTEDIEEAYKLVSTINPSGPVVFQPNGMFQMLDTGLMSPHMKQLGWVGCYLEQLKSLWMEIQKPRWQYFDMHVVPQMHTMLFGHQAGI